MELTTPRSTKPDEQPLSPLVSPRLDSASVEHVTRDEQPPQVEPSVVISLIFTTRTDLVVKMLREHLDLDQDMPAAQVVEQGVTVLGLSEEVNGLPLDKQAEACLATLGVEPPPSDHARQATAHLLEGLAAFFSSFFAAAASFFGAAAAVFASVFSATAAAAGSAAAAAGSFAGAAAGSAFASIRLCFNSTFAPSQPTDELVRMRTSSSDDQIVEGSWPQGIIKPTVAWKGRWDFIIMLLILYSAAVVPLRMAFSAEANGLLWDFEAMMSLAFITDVTFNFNTAYLEDGVWVVSRGLIAKRYCQGWVWIDAPSSVPVELIELLLPNTSSASSLQTLRFLRLFRLARLLRLLKIDLYINLLEDYLETNLRPLRLVKLVMKLLFAAHMLACGWFWASTLTTDNEEEYESGEMRCPRMKRGRRYRCSMDGGIMLTRWLSRCVCLL